MRRAVADPELGYADVHVMMVPNEFSPCRRPAYLALFATLWALLFGLGAAQVPADGLDPAAMPDDAVVGTTGSDPEALADRAVEMWLALEPTSFSDLAGLETEALCRELPALFAAPPPPSGTEVDLSDRRARETDDPDRRRYTYAAEIPPDRLDVVEVILMQDGDDWRVERVGFQMETSTGRDWLQTREAGIGFILFSLLIVGALARPTPIRRWLLGGRDALRAHPRVVRWTFVLGWAVVALGLFAGSQLPDSCEQAVVSVLSDTLEQVGATQALASGDLARTALVIFYQNFVVVTFTALFGSALLLGVPVYLLAGVSFLAQSTAFGLLGLGGFPEIVAILVLFVIEFTAYFLVVTGGGMLVATLAQRGFGGIGDGYRKLVSMLPLAGLLLLLGAWYEAVVLLGF